jgi:hypothetical protein
VNRSPQRVVRSATLAPLLDHSAVTPELPPGAGYGVTHTGDDHAWWPSTWVTRR